MRIDAIRDTIAEWSAARLLSATEQGLLIAALIEAADKVANTAGTYFAYLKQIYRKAAKPLSLLPFQLSNNGYANSCNLIDARDLVTACHADILYLDPPYNERKAQGAWYRIFGCDRPHNPRR
jgi:adenine-specific DNA-methyltransferase